MSTTLYHWAGKTVLSDTVLERKRTVAGRDGGARACRFDIRRWVLPPDDDLMRETWQRIAARQRKHLSATGTGALEDLKAKAVWRFVIEHIEFSNDHGPDFWQLPQETLALGHGDCEDQSFLTASLLLGAGIVPRRVRVAIGAVVQRGVRRRGSDASANGPELSARPASADTQRHHLLRGHAWPMYRDDRGHWRVLETSLVHLPVVRRGRVVQPKRAVGIDRAVLLSADKLAAEGRRHQYVPLICLNHRRVWTVPETARGTVRGADTVQPDWRRGPSFREIWSREERWLHGLGDVGKGDTLLE